MIALTYLLIWHMFGLLGIILAINFNKKLYSTLTVAYFWVCVAMGPITILIALFGIVAEMRKGK